MMFRKLKSLLSCIFIISLATFIHGQKSDTFQDRLKFLTSKANDNNGVIPLDLNDFQYILSTPRDYDVAVLFTAMSPEYQCVQCKNFDSEFKLIATSLSKIPNNNNLFLASIDFKTGQQVFVDFGITGAPSLLYFPAINPNGDLDENQLPFHDPYRFNARGYQAESLASWLSSKSGLALSIKRPIDFLVIAIKLIGLMAIISFSYMVYTRAGDLLRSKYPWMALSLFTIFIMISGHMWNQIRRPPYSVVTPEGRVSYIAAGFQNQFGLETQIIAVIYAILTGGVVSLINLAPTIEDPAKQKRTIFVWLAVFGLAFSVLLLFFRTKNPGYPYHFIF